MSKPSSKLYDAIKSGDHDKLKAILKEINPKKLDMTRGNDFFCRIMGIENLTPLQYACAVGDMESVRLLVEAGAECTACKNVLKELLMLTVEESEDPELCREQLDYFRRVYELCRAGSDKPMTEKYPSLLYMAAGSRNTMIAEFVLGEGFSLNPEPDKESGHASVPTPLGRAAEHGDVKMVEYLLSQGADAGLRDRDNKTPLEAVRDFKKEVETREVYKSERKYLDNYDRVIEILERL